MPTAVPTASPSSLLGCSAPDRRCAPWMPVVNMPHVRTESPRPAAPRGELDDSPRARDVRRSTVTRDHPAGGRPPSTWAQPGWVPVGRHLHRRGSARARRPRCPGEVLTGCVGQGGPASPARREPAPFLPGSARPSRHAHPQHGQGGGHRGQPRSAHRGHSHPVHSRGVVYATDAHCVAHAAPLRASTTRSGRAHEHTQRLSLPRLRHEGGLHRARRVEAAINQLLFRTLAGIEAMDWHLVSLCRHPVSPAICMVWPDCHMNNQGYACCRLAS